MNDWPKGARIIGPDIGPRPAWAKACIVAEYETDESDIQTDYFATRTQTTVPLAWSRHTRDIFSEMRKAAATFKPTRHLGPGCDVWTARVVLCVPAPGYFVSNGGMIHDGDRDHNPERQAKTFQTEAEAKAYAASFPALLPCHYGEHVVTYRWEITCESIEHREKYSMGAGYYLKGSCGYSTGWTVSKVTYRLEDIERMREQKAQRKPCITTGPPATERGVCPLCHAETKPGEQLYTDGSCWPQCLPRLRLVVEPMYPDAARS